MATLLAGLSGAATSAISPARDLLAPDRIPDRALPGAGSTLWGRTVAAIRLDAKNADELQTRITLKVGDRLTRPALRQSVAALDRSGRFANIEVEATALASGDVQVEFRTTPNYFFGGVTVSGLAHSAVSENGVANAARLDLGTLFSEEKIQSAQTRILRLLHDDGYWQATVTPTLQRQEEKQQVEVTFHVVVGTAAHVGRLSVSGDPTLSDEQAAELCKVHSGVRARSELLQRAANRMRKYYLKQRRLRAQLTVGVPVFHAASNTVDYSFQIERGPVVDIRTEGMKLNHAKLKKLVPVYEEHAVDEDLLNEGRNKLRDYLQRLGYFDASVQVRVEDDAAHDRQHIIYAIQPGAQQRLVAIEFVGNHRFDEATLRERMTLQTVSFLQPHGRYGQTLVDADLGAIRGLYRANGYPSVKVSSAIVAAPPTPGDLKLRVSLDEGPLVRVGALEIHGAHAVGEAEIRGLLNTQVGQPYSDTTVADDRDAVLNDYLNRGFPAAQLESKASYADAAHTRVNVVYDITEGAQQFVRHVYVDGAEHAKPHIVQRAVVIHPGEPLSQEKMLTTQRNFYDLGIFTEVQTATQNPDGDEHAKDVLFHLQEAKRWTFRYGGGLEVGSGLYVHSGTPQGGTGASPRVTFDVTRINFRGRNQSLILKSHFGALEKRASLSFDQPRWFDWPDWRLTVTGLYDDAHDVTTFASDRLEGSVQLTERVSKSTQMMYRFSYRRVKAYAFSSYDPNLIPIYSRPARVGMPAISYVHDTRDNPLMSTKGIYATLDLGVASSVFGSQANFGRAMGQIASYHKFHRNWVLAHSLRLGVESPYGSLRDQEAAGDSSVSATSLLIPLPERYFVGGSNSHRGFAINQAGPRDSASGAPLGGNAMIVNSFELRFPPTPLPWLGDNVSFVLFHDIGNAFATSNQMWKNLTRMNQRNSGSCRDLSASGTCDFNYMPSAVGTGVRYKTPIGPVRVDLGYNLNPPMFPVKAPCSGISNCSKQPYADEGRHFNFYFSIGQTF